MSNAGNPRLALARWYFAWVASVRPEARKKTAIVAPARKLLVRARVEVRLNVREIIDGGHDRALSLKERAVSRHGLKSRGEDHPLGQRRLLQGEWIRRFSPGGASDRRKRNHGVLTMRRQLARWSFGDGSN